MNAIKVFGASGKFTRSISEISVDSVIVINDDAMPEDTQNPLLYVVNYTNNYGFSIIPANSNAGDILAFVENGHYDSATLNWTNTAIKSIIENAKHYIKNAINAYNPISPQKQQSDKYVNDTLLTQITPKLSVKWGQNCGWGYYAPNELAGCANVAMGQIMSYFESPTSMQLTFNERSCNSIVLDWQAIKNHRYIGFDWEQNNMIDTIAMFLRQLGENNSTEYIQEEDHKGSRTNIDDVASEFRRLGYTVVKHDQIRPTSNITDALSHDKLILMQGMDVLGIKPAGHAWVVDGYKNYNVTSRYYTKYADEEFWTLSQTINYNSLYLHINWGERGNADGYFLYNILSPNHGYEYDNYLLFRLDETNYTRDNKYLIISR